MAVTRPVTTSLAEGEWSNRARDAFSREGYFESASRVLNFFSTTESSTTRRPGSLYNATLSFANEAYRLVPFTKSTDDTLIAIVADNVIRLYDIAANDWVMTTATPAQIVELASPWSAASLPYLYWWQSGDVLWITDKTANTPPQVIIRYYDASWVIQEHVSKSGPYLPEQFDAENIRYSATEGNVSLLTHGDMFTEDMVGSVLRLNMSAYGIPFESWEPKATTVAGVDYYYNGRVYRPSSAAENSNQPPVHEEGTVFDGRQKYWTYLHDLQGVVRITEVLTLKHAKGDVEERLPALSGLANGDTNYWAEGAFSTKNGWPRIGGIFEQRLCYMSTKAQPDTFWASRTAGYSPIFADFKPSNGVGTVVDDNGLNNTLTDGQVNIPSWMLSTDYIYLGTPHGVIRITGPSADEPLTPAGALARKVPDAPGSYGECRGILTDTTMVYVSRGGQRLIEMRGDETTRELTDMCRQVGAARIARLEWAGEPYYRLFLLNENGYLWCCTYETGRREKFAAARVEFGGQYKNSLPIVEDICAVPNGQNSDQLYAIVLRTINGKNHRSLERLAEDFNSEAMEPEDAVCLDAAVIYNSHNQESGQLITLADLTTQPKITASEDVELLVGDIVRFTADGNDGREQIRVRIIEQIIEGDEVVCELVGSYDADSLELFNNKTSNEWAIEFSQYSEPDHLKGEDVFALLDGAEYGPLTAVDGMYELPVSAVQLVLGLSYNYEIISQSLFTASSKGNSRGTRLGVDKAYISLIDTGPSALSLSFISDGMEAPPIELGLPMSAQARLDLSIRFGSVTEEVSPQCHKGRDVRARLFGSGAYPVTITLVGLEVSGDD